MIRSLANRFGRRLALVVVVAVLGIAAGAAAYFTSQGSGIASARVGSISAPTDVDVQQIAARVTIGWGAGTSSADGGVEGYRVHRSDGTAVCGDPTLVTELSCADTTFPSGTSTYTVTAVYKSFTASAASAPITLLQASIALSPTSGHVGDSVTITGSNFPAGSAITATYAGSALTLSPTTPSIDEAGSTPSAMTFTVPASTAGTHTVQVSAGTRSASATYTVTAQITVSPTTGKVGSTDSINGTGFAAGSTITAKLATTTVTLGGITATDSSGSFSAATYTVPGATAGDHTVVVSDSATPTANSATATFTIMAEITLTPTRGPVGSTVSITGTGFAASQTITATFHGATVTLGGATTTASNGSFGGATYAVPTDPAGSYLVVVTDASENTATANFTLDASVAALSPTSGPVGAAVSITVQRFAGSSALAVTVGGTTATITSGATTDSEGASTVTFTIPAAANGARAVVVSDASSNHGTSPTNFTIDARITLSPTSGVAGATDTITGTGFAASSTITATFGGPDVALTGASSDASGSFIATYTVPNHASGAATVVATDASTKSASATYTIDTPTITLNPASGHVGDAVTIAGSSFPTNSAITATYDGASLSLGGTPSTDSSGASAGNLALTVPASTIGPHTVQVTAGTRTATATFTVAPRISLSPTSGVAGATGTITGAGFAASSAITATFGGVTVTLSGGPSDPSGSVTATYTVPNQAPGATTLVATDGLSNTASATYTIDTPTITLNPAAGTNGATVALAGSRFPAGSSISATWDGGVRTLSGTTTTTGAGAIPSGVTFPVPGTATAGEHTVQVTADGQSATAVFTVTPTFTVTASTPQTAGTSFPVTITAEAGGQTDTSYGGAKTLTFAGPSNSPTGTVPAYPTTVSFTSGVGTATVTLVDAQATTLTVTDANSTSITGTSATIVVNAGGPTAIVFSPVGVSNQYATSWSCNAFATSCSAMITNDPIGTWTFKVGVIDAQGNAVTAGAGGIVVGHTAPSLGNGSTLKPTSVTIVQGQAVSSSGFTYTAVPGAYGPETFDLTATGMTSALGSVTHF